jgi:hypothetical protein
MTAMISRLGGPLARAGVATLVFIASLLAVIRQSLDPATANHDVAWTLYAGEQLFAGAEYGVDIIELNPPFILWVGSLVAALNRLVEAPIILLFNLLVLLMTVGFGVALWQILKRAYGRSDIAAAIAIMMSAALVYIPSYGYGQRDHLIFLLITPHLLLCALCVDREFKVRATLRVAAGCAMAAALCMKPHFALAWIGAEVTMLYYARRADFLTRIENWVAAGGCLVFGAYLLAFEQHYFVTVRAAISLYGAYDAPLSIIDWHFAPLACSVALMLLVRPRDAAGRCAVVSLMASLAGAVAVIVQSKGYDYHFIPCQLSAALALACTLGAWVQSDRMSTWLRTELMVPVGVLAGLIIAIAMAGNALLYGVDEIYMPNRNIVRVVQEFSGGEPVLFFSDSLSPAFPVLTITGNRSTSPYSCLWQIAGHYTPAELAEPQFPYRSLAEMSEAEREFVVGLVDRVERTPPRLILFDIRSNKYSFKGARFSYERYFRADERFQVLMRDYRPVANVGGYRALLRSTRSSG